MTHLPQCSILSQENNSLSWWVRRKYQLFPSYEGPHSLVSPTSWVCREHFRAYSFVTERSQSWALMLNQQQQVILQRSLKQFIEQMELTPSQVSTDKGLSQHHLSTAQHTSPASIWWWARSPCWQNGWVWLMNEFLTLPFPETSAYLGLTQHRHTLKTEARYILESNRFGYRVGNWKDNAE